MSEHFQDSISIRKGGQFIGGHIFHQPVPPRVARDEDRRQQELTKAAIAWHVHADPLRQQVDAEFLARVRILHDAEARLHRAVEALLGD